MSSFGNQIKHYGGIGAEVVGEHVEKYVDIAAGQVRDTLSQQTWLPDAVRSRIPAATPEPEAIIINQANPERWADWIVRHRILATIGGVGWVSRCDRSD